ICGDAANLPLPDETGDVVLAMSMLYHVAERDRSLEELRRVLVAGGTFLASASSSSNMPEFIYVWERATTDILGHGVGVAERWERRFNIENGGHLLDRFFDDVTLHRFG